MLRKVMIFQLIILSCFLSTVVQAAAIDYSCLHSNSWLVNTNSHYNFVFSSSTDITSSAYSSSTSKWSAVSTGIPNYDRTFTAADISTLNARPLAGTEFRSDSKTTAVAGSSYVYGADLNYKTTRCVTGYWPPGPECPSSKSVTSTYTLTPATETSSTGCYFGLGSDVGMYVNGVQIWNWSDANTYNSAGVWYNLAGKFEETGMDVCLGHAANGVYHHHFHAPCLAEKLGDTGTGHSPIYGFGPDGYPIYGPYQAAGKLASSCWMARDYSSAATGCSGGARTCKLTDEFDYTKGTTATSSAGPSLTGILYIYEYMYTYIYICICICIYIYITLL
jgi:hypothetical protein